MSRSTNVKADLSTEGLFPLCHIVPKRRKLDFQSMRSTVIDEPLMQLCEKRKHCAKNIGFVCANNLMISVGYNNNLRGGVVCF